MGDNDYEVLAARLPTEETIHQAVERLEDAIARERSRLDIDKKKFIAWNGEKKWEALEAEIDEAVGAAVATARQRHDDWAERCKTALAQAEAAPVPGLDLEKAAAMKVFVEEDVANLDAPALAREVKKAMERGDNTRLWLLRRYASHKADEVAHLMPTRMGGGGGEPPDVRDLRAVLSEADKKLVDPKAAELRDRALTRLRALGELSVTVLHYGNTDDIEKLIPERLRR